MAEIVHLPPQVRNTLVWRCSCGCISFELRANGDAVCVQCEHPIMGADGTWREKLPALILPVDPVSDTDVTITDLNSSGAALRRVLGKASPDTTAMVIVLQKDGGVTTWGEGIDGEAHAEWFDRRIHSAKQMLTNSVREK